MSSSLALLPNFGRLCLDVYGELYLNVESFLQGRVTEV